MVLAKSILKGFATGLCFGILLTYITFEYRYSGTSFRNFIKCGAVRNVEHYEHLNQWPNSSKKIRVLCWILTSPKSIETKGKAVKDTWGKRCDTLLFIPGDYR